MKIIKLEVKPSLISGLGSFATKRINPGDYVTTLTGELFAAKELLRMCAEHGLSDVDPLQISEEFYLILNPAAKVINHSCNPNCGIRNANDLFAIAPIEVGTEITYDYSTTVGVTETLSMICHCGAPNCRENISNILSIPQIAITKYLQLNVLPDFIKRELRI